MWAGSTRFRDMESRLEAVGPRDARPSPDFEVGHPVVHFRHALRHEAFSDRREQLALRAVTLGLVVVGTSTAVESTRRLIGHVESHAVPTGAALAAMSIGVLGLLAVRKHRTAGRIPSRALLADGWLSAIGCLLAIVTGTGLTSAYGWWWVDPLAAAAVACVALTIAAVMARR